jgi:beta-glucosidase
MPSSMPVSFPDEFLWGCSTAAYQIEGSPLADGAGASIWQRFSRIPGKVLNSDTGDIACDHYRRYRQDIDLMRQLGMQAYRFSIAWGRILPGGFGEVNKRGLDFYDRLVDALLGANISPMATLYHWDLPQALDERGGWLNPDIANWFGDYAELVFDRLDDRIERWITVNEPWVISDQGYLRGAHAPGHSSHYEAAIASHNLMSASAEAWPLQAATVCQAQSTYTETGWEVNPQAFTEVLTWVKERAEANSKRKRETLHEHY